MFFQYFILIVLIISFIFVTSLLFKGNTSNKEFTKLYHQQLLTSKLFNEQKYSKYTDVIRFEIEFIYCISIITSTILMAIIWQLIENILISLGIFTLGILFANLYTKGLEIKLQEMYWRLDTYEKIMKGEK